MILGCIGVTDHPRIIDVDLKQIGTMRIDNGASSRFGRCPQKLLEERPREEDGMPMLARVSRYDQHGWRSSELRYKSLDGGTAEPRHIHQD